MIETPVQTDWDALQLVLNGRIAILGTVLNIQMNFIIIKRRLSFVMRLSWLMCDCLTMTKSKNLVLIL